MAFKMKYGKAGFPFKQKDSWVVKAGKLDKTEDGFNVADKDKNYSVSKEEYETYIKENNSSASTANIPYNAKLIIKDYHNIRGHTTTSVASTSNISFKKAGFRLDNT